MIIWRYKPAGCTNFGDALNDYLWPRLLPQKFADIPGNFYGIGTVLGGQLPDEPRHVVFGAGTGYSLPPKLDDRWKIYFVRGPFTSQRLGGVPWLIDPGILVHHFFPQRRLVPSFPCAFMPRWDSMSPELVEGCRKANIEVIDPRLSINQVITAIQSTELLLTEALHGAVVADVLRVPWISIYAQRGHEFKWQDFCWSLEQVWNPIDMETFSLTWARKYAVPQLSAASILDKRKLALDRALDKLVLDIEGGNL